MESLLRLKEFISFINLSSVKYTKLDGLNKRVFNSQRELKLNFSNLSWSRAQKAQGSFQLKPEKPLILFLTPFFLSRPKNRIHVFLSFNYFDQNDFILVEDF